MVAWRAYDLDLIDYKIFLELRKDPFQSNSAIAKTLGMSAEAIRTRIHALKSKGFLRPNRKISDPVLGNRVQSDVEAIYNPHQIGLQRDHVFFTEIEDRKSLNVLKKICDAHPYTHYRTVAYSDKATLYVQFDYPPNIAEKMKVFYGEIGKSGVAQGMDVKHAKYRASANPDLKQWDIKKNRWNVEYGSKSGVNEKLSRLENIWSQSLNGINGYRANEVSINHNHNLDNLDMCLLRELTVNAQPSIKALGLVYDKDPTTISRRISKIRDSYILQNALYYDRRVFDLTYNQIITGNFRPDSGLTPHSLIHFVESKAMPFQTRVTADDDTFIMFVTTPPSLAPEYSEFFWEHARDVSIQQLQLDASFTYFFYHKNYDENTGWKEDKEYVVDEPLSVVNL